ncbi:hypothetical protein AB6A40_006980 [Gnathostoma spinigerum]|uniref:Fungal lipase-type domain-containing protein n=1 Tax=Gnathostoma spinigerum TaxID=75299 RepID=A0ABD6EKI5_9BILA
MWPSIEPILRDPLFSEYAVTVTGHSLGGALASLAALKIALDKLRPSHQIKMISFGQPRVGDYQLAVSHNKLVPNSFRVVHRKDIVPHVPPCDKNDSHSIDDSKACDISSTDIAYHHLTEVWYPEDMVGGGQYIVCNGHPLGEDMKCSDKLIFKLSGRKEYVYDHRHYFGHRLPVYGKNGCREVAGVLPRLYGGSKTLNILLLIRYLLAK